MKCFVRAVFALAVVLGLLVSGAVAKGPGEEGRKIRVLLTVGGHDFEEKPFLAILDAMPDAQWTKIELPKEADRLAPGLERNFDLIVMYDMAASFTPAQQQAFVDLKNNPELAWTTEYGKSRVFYLMLGHDAQSYDNPDYRKIVHQGIRWAAAH